MIVDTVKEKLTQQLDATHVEVTDNSWMHAGHAGAAAGGSHLAVLVVSPKFNGVSIIDQHRMVQDTLKAEMVGAIHALEVKTLTPDKWAK